MEVDIMRGEELVGLAMATSFVVADGLEAGDLLTLGDFFTMIGTNLIAIADARGKEADKENAKNN
jgi:hypothetical protein